MTQNTHPRPGCATCYLWARTDADTGECRAAPPVLVPVLAAVGLYGRWPLTLVDGFCKLHEPSAQVRLDAANAAFAVRRAQAAEETTGARSA